MLGRIFKISLLENILQSHVDIVTLITLDRVSQQSYEDSVRQDLVNLLVVPNTIIVIIIVSCFSKTNVDGEMSHLWNMNMSKPSLAQGSLFTMEALKGCL